MLIDSGGAAFLAAAMIRRFEGLRLAPYYCEAGKLTIGYGHVILLHENDLRAGIDEAEAEALLLRDLSWAMFAARNVGRVLEDGQAAALASLIFNIGLTAWNESTIRKLVMAGDFAGAAQQFGVWIKAGKRVSEGLVTRRASEKNIFGGGVWIG